MKKTLLFFISFLFFIASTNATHWVAGNIEYECVGGNQYLVRIITFWDCGGATANTTIDLDFESSCSGQFSETLNRIVINPGGVEPTEEPMSNFLCESQQQCSECEIFAPTTDCPIVLPGILKIVYETTVDLSDCDDWVISYSSCCRNDPDPNISNHPGNENWYVYANLNNLDAPCNSSPSFFSNLRAYICEGQENTLDFSSIDPEGDQLVYSLVYPLTGPGTPITIETTWPYDEKKFIKAQNGVALDSLTGIMILTPDDSIVGTNQTAFFSIKVDEYRNGEIIGSIIRDVQVVTLEDCQPMEPFSGGIGELSLPESYINDTTLYVCAGDSLSFSILILDTVYADTLFITTDFAALIPSSTFTENIISPGFTSGSFVVTPTNDDVGIYTYQVQVENNGCPVKILEIFYYTIQIFGATEAEVSIDTTCVGQGDSLLLTAIGGEEFLWTVLGEDSTWADCDTCAITKILPPRTVDYLVVSELDIYGCINKDTVTVNRVPLIKPLENKDICFEDSTFLAIDWAWTPSDGVRYKWNEDDSQVDTIFFTNQAETYFYFIQDTVDHTDSVVCFWTDTADVIIIDCPVSIPNIFTPNDDTYNDVFKIDNIENKIWNLTVYSRWGKTVLKEFLDYQNDWDGEELNDGTYFVVLTNQDGGVLTTLKSWVIIAR